MNMRDDREAGADASAGEVPAAGSAQWRWLLLLCCLVVTVLMHARSFTEPHVEGDEVAFLALASEMGWDLSHYTTMDHPLVRQFPYRLYQSPLFVHPPGWPLMLKVAGLVGHPVPVGLSLQLVAMVVLLLAGWRALYLLKQGGAALPVLWVLLLFCPTLLFSTTRLHADGLLGICLFTALVVHMEALERGSLAGAAVAGLLWALALNLKFTAVAFLPVLVFVQLNYLLRQAPEASGAWAGLVQAARQWRHWRSATIVGLLVLTIGLQHYYRLFVVYDWSELRPLLMGAGSSQTAVSPADVPFLAGLGQIGPWRRLVYILLVYPVFLLLLSPLMWRMLKDAWQQRDWRLTWVAAMGYVLVLLLARQSPQMRYFAAVLPLMFLTVTLLLPSRKEQTWQVAFAALAGGSLWLMITTGYVATILVPDSARVIPSIFFYLPDLLIYFK